MFSAGEVPTEVELHQVSKRLLYVLCSTIRIEQQFINYRSNSVGHQQVTFFQVFKGVSSEITVVATVDARLAATVARNVAKTVRLTCVKCEQVLVTDGEASQVIGYPTDGQRRNVAIVNCLSRFRAGIESIVRESGIGASTRGGGVGDDGAVADSIVEALEDVDKQVRNGINPLLSSIEDALEAIILTMHKEDFSTGGEGVPSLEDAMEEVRISNCSPFMKELHTFVSRVCMDYLQDFVCREFVSSCLLPVCVCTVDRFVTHASIVRPLGRDGRRRLAVDCSQLELALEPLLLGGNWASSPDLSPSLSSLRGLRSLLFVPAEDVAGCEVVRKGDIPASVALHLLFSFGPAELRSPHESAGWSVSRYSQWLEDHPSERDRLQLIQGTLESYVAATRARQQKSYAFPYPIMLEMLEKFNQ